ncbi:MAG: hypothetical protein GY873_07925 [Bosea sp.]|uniref:hypothetical protein n=1 Tax=Bosea sp. (in: a-proteobacteria) TaxID=1871050 RepID=UPI0023912172|nr:hypothetical protein [Bosea sp. (in: a-proteobacteria)]MCP4734107.1 hypothetical protein [Bosea sp. (in: a-proteobacteria)]
MAKVLSWWEKKRCSDVKPSTCEAYAKFRGAEGAARRELEDLRAALRLAWKERIVTHPIPVVLPPPGYRASAG